MATSFAKVIIFVVCINVLLYTGGVRVLGGDNEDFVSRFINVNESVNGSVVVSDDINRTLPTSFNQGGSSLLQFIDSLGAIQEIIFFIINIVFTPLGLLVSAGIPSDIVIIFGVPLIVFMWLGVAYFIRSGN